MSPAHRVWYRDRVMLGLACSILCSIVLFGLYEGQSSKLDGQAAELRGLALRVLAAQQSIGSQYVAQIESCRRLNILRVEDNLSHFADWRVFRVVSIENRLGPPATTRQAAEFRAAFLPALNEGVAAKEWTPRTNCGRAVNRRGARFRAPRPIPFNVRLPDYSALHLYPSDFQ